MPFASAKSLSEPESPSALWGIYEMVSPLALLSVPVWGMSSPQSSFKMLDLPQPFLPCRATRSPR